MVLIANFVASADVDITIVGSVLNTSLSPTHNTTNRRYVLCECTILNSDVTIVCKVCPNGVSPSG